ncbi:MAG: AAA family ATPase [Actinomycetota bacterium]
MLTKPPTGTVTFLFTDMEGSTRLLQTLGADYDRLLEDQRRILCDSAERHDGFDLGVEGDACHFAFVNASDAVASALEAQLGLANHPWPPQGQVKVRMGINTGEARLSGEAYVGLALHKTARICDAGHGGQVLLTTVTKDLADITGQASFDDLGEHVLKDLGRPERILQLVHVDLESKFPPLRTIDMLPNNLPFSMTSFVGRQHQIVEVTNLLKSSRLVTLLGPGGAGKTRLALQTAAEVLDRYTQGAWMIDLATTTTGEGIYRTIAAALRISESRGEGQVPVSDDVSGTGIERILGHLKTSEALLVLDNCEHLVADCAEFAESLLRQCPKVAILATSRQPLEVPGEARWNITPLSLPLSTNENLDEIAAHEAVALFVERAQLNQVGFALTSSNAGDVIEICRRLDGMPLAIELAAAWVHALSPKQIVERLDDQFKLLAASVRRGPGRQQTLRAAIDWSYDLLPKLEKRLLENLTIFTAGFTLEAAERVCSTEGITPGAVLHLLSQLINKSLVARDAETDRYRLLGTIKQYGWEKLTTDLPMPLPSSDLVFKREGDFWSVGSADSPTRLKHSKGLAYVYLLISNPGREWHALDLAQTIEGVGLSPELKSSDAGDVLDETARLQFKTRIQDLEADIAEARLMNDAERAASAQDEIEAITRSLSEAFGIGGRARKTGSAAEKARMAVSKAIKGTIDRIEELVPGTGSHLRRAIKTGTYCSYEPGESFRWGI